MKIIFFLFALSSLSLKAQVYLKFDKRYVQSEDRWVAFAMREDSTYPYGFIYIDAQAGLTFNYEGYFKINQSGKFIPKKIDSTNIKYRLEANNVKVAFIPESRFEELNIPVIPEWLKYYKNDVNSIERLYRWGYMYNGWDECEKALTYLEKAEAINPKFKGLAVELSFSYNCLKQFDKAEAILEEEIKTNPTDAYVNKEYIYTLSKNNNIDKAASQFDLSVRSLKDHKYDAENCYNILQHYYLQKDKGNFNKWYNILQLQPNENKMITQYADNMKKDINK